MATNSWRGDYQPIAQVTTVTVGGTPANGQIYTVTINSKFVKYTATGGDTNSTIGTALLALLQACTFAEFTEITWTGVTTVITATSRVAGTPFTLSSSATGTGTFVNATTTSATGPNQVDEANNWTLGRVPAGECSPPVQAAASASSGGTLVDTTPYYWVITATNALGETLKSNQQTLTIAAPNQTANLSWAAVVGATGYKVYRSTTTNVYTPTALRATISSGSTLTYVDNGGALSAGATPGSNTATGDDVYLPLGSSSILYGTALSYVVWNSLHVDASYSGYVGLLDNNPAGYREYRNTKLQASPKNIYFGENDGPGTSLFRLDSGSNQVAWWIYRTGPPAVQGLHTLSIYGSHASNTLAVQQGDVGIATEEGTTANFSGGITVGYLTSPANDVTLEIGSGTTQNQLTLLGGNVENHANLTTLTLPAGSAATFTQWGTATLGAISGKGGYIIYNSSGTITSGTIDSGCTFDHSQDLRALTITNITLRSGCTFLDPARKITFTNPFVVDGALDKINHKFGSVFNVQFS